jgi:hypothetical protein
MAFNWVTTAPTPMSIGPPTAPIAPLVIKVWPRAESLMGTPNTIATPPAPVIKIPKASRIKDILVPAQPLTPAQDPRRHMVNKNSGLKPRR